MSAPRHDTDRREPPIIREHGYEPQPGLPEELPAGEKVLWRGKPDWLTLAVQADGIARLCLEHCFDTDGCRTLLHFAVAHLGLCFCPDNGLHADKPASGLSHRHGDPSHH